MVILMLCNRWISMVLVLLLLIACNDSGSYSKNASKSHGSLYSTTEHRVPEQKLPNEQGG